MRFLPIALMLLASFFLSLTAAATADIPPSSTDGKPPQQAPVTDWLNKLFLESAGDPKAAATRAAKERARLEFEKILNGGTAAANDGPAWHGVLAAMTRAGFSTATESFFAGDSRSAAYQALFAAARSGIDGALGAARETGLPGFALLETEYNFGIDQKPEYSLLTVIPLHETADLKHSFFSQASFRYSNSRSTLNTGFGYRYMTDDKKWLYGVNAFLDHQWPYDHTRASLGVDVKTSMLGFYANRYVPVSGWRESRLGYEEQALGGGDIGFSGGIAQLPDLELFVEGYEWQQHEGLRDRRGARMSAEYTPFPAFTFLFDLGHDSQEDFTFGAGLRYNVAFGHEGAGQFDARAHNGLTSIADRRFEKVRRENNIIVQERQAPGRTATVAETIGANTALLPNGTVVALAVGQDILYGSTITTSGGGGDYAQFSFGSGAVLRIGAGSQVLIEAATITLLNGSMQYISGSTNVVINVPGGTVTLLGTDIDAVTDGTTSTVRVRDGMIRVDGDDNNSVTANEGDIVVVGGQPTAILASNDPLYEAHEETIYEDIDSADPTPVATAKAAPYVAVAPAIVTAPATTSGDDLVLRVVFTKPVTVTGLVQLEFTLNGLAREAVYDSGSGSANIDFLYNTQAADAGEDEITITGLDLNGGSIMGDSEAAVTYVPEAVLALPGPIADTGAPTGYAVAFTTDPVTQLNETAAAFQITGAEIGATYDYTISSSGGGVPVTDTGTIATATQTISGIDVSGLNDGTLTVSLTLTDVDANTGAPVTDTVIKNTTAVAVAVTSSAPEPTDTSPIPFTIVFTSAVTGFVVGDLSLTNGTASNFATGDNITWTVDITPGGQGAVSVQVPAGVAASGGNANSVSNTETRTFDTVGPAGYAAVFTTDPVNAGNVTAAAFDITSAEIGATYDYSITSSGGGAAVTDSGTVAAATESVTGINLSGLNDGTLTVSVTLTDPLGNAGAAATDTVLKDIVAPAGYAVAFTTDPIGPASDTATVIQLTSAEVGATFDYSITSSGGGTAVTGSGTIATATQDVTGIDVSGLGDGTLTVSVTLTDTGENTGAAATDTAQKAAAPSLLMDFAGGNYTLNGTAYGSIGAFITAAGASFARNSAGTYFDSSGVMQNAAVNTPRIDHDPATGTPRGILIEESSTNVITNNTMVGAGAGSLPTGWSVSASAGISSQIIGSGVEDGIPYVDIRFFGTSTGNTFPGVIFLGATVYAAGPGAILTDSAYVRLVGGNKNNTQSHIMVMSNHNAGGGALNQFATGTCTVTTDALKTQRCAATASATTFTNVNTARIRPYYQFQVPSAGLAINMTVRVGLPQMEAKAFATSPIRTSGAAATRQADIFSVPTGSWFDAAKGTFMADSYGDINSNQPLHGRIIGNEGTKGYLENEGSLSQLGTYSDAGSPFSIAMASPLSQTTAHKMAMRWRQSDTTRALITTGTALAGDSYTGDYTSTQIAVGSRGGTGNFRNAPIRKIEFYPATLSDADMAAIIQ